MGKWLIELEEGQTADLTLKAPRIMHDATYSTNRWTELGLVAGGTGIAPLMQMVRAVLSDPSERTKISVVFANRFVDDILLKDELDSFALTQPDRFRVHYVLSTPPPEGSDLH